MFCTTKHFIFIIRVRHRKRKSVTRFKRYKQLSFYDFIKQIRVYLLKVVNSIAGSIEVAKAEEM